MQKEQPSRVNILWTNDNRVTAELMVFMYATNAKMKGWFDEVQIIIWGSTAELAAKNEDIQVLIQNAQSLGVHISACLSCANALGVRKELENLDIELIYWGEPLTEILKSGEKLITV